ncbi:MAG: polya polymerase [Eubacteriales bacterium]|jgi:hypothetical protein
MKIENVNNVEGLMKVLSECKGKVELVSDEGDRINMNSKLSQMLMMSKLLDKAYIKELELIVHEPEDMKKVLNFMMSDANKAE